MTKYILLILGFVLGWGLSTKVSNHLQSLELMLNLMGIKNSKVVLAQAIHETDLFSSKIYKENHNLFGLKCAKHRVTYCIGENRGHAIFKSKGHCVMDYKEWQDKYYPEYVLSDQEYIDFLATKAYAEDPQYLTRIRHWYRILNTN